MIIYIFVKIYFFVKNIFFVNIYIFVKIYISVKKLLCKIDTSVGIYICVCENIFCENHIFVKITFILKTDGRTANGRELGASGELGGECKRPGWARVGSLVASANGRHGKLAGKAETGGILIIDYVA